MAVQLIGFGEAVRPSKRASAEIGGDGAIVCEPAGSPFRIASSMVAQSKPQGVSAMAAQPRIEIVQGDITRVEADAIVNAANIALAEGAGVCGAILRAAGRNELAAACCALAPCPTGSAVITPAFGIATAKHIIHAVGPIYSQHTPDDARELLRSAYRASIERAIQNGCRSIAFPAISTGIYGYPLEEACREAVAVCKAASMETGILVKLVAFDARSAGVLRSYAEG
jgi:O-acetyl-ADP-ribose deacetylase